MQVFDFENLVKTEKAARHYILGCCEKTGRMRCQSCGSDKAYVIENGDRRRCAHCDHSFHPLQGRWIHRVKISSQKWLWIVKLFELNSSAKMICEETGISYPTILKSVDVLRMAIAGSPMPCEDTGYTCGRGAGVPILGLSKGGHEAVQVLETAPAELIKCTMKLWNGLLVCADKSLPYNSLMFENEELSLVDRGQHFPHCKVYGRNIEKFWQYAKERFVKYHGISDKKIVLLVREMEFRYLHRDEQLFDLLVEKLCHYAPV